ncbi:hypothetical protein QFW96_16630 [Saccharopolyspora sp. TS4A08]|uniref:SRPBCC family protein n=1 Tax=Saccharopolyspora ipomoeae TaxID=3042027 RepID=A0ABT6PQH7_9PSEU|nr:hypothetical protein [Saccharopolyspora sp. TS4A08]MDI2030257.1 hypothetical protein [Saccharopolyspora sp. TS4A08]
MNKKTGETDAISESERKNTASASWEVTGRSVTIDDFAAECDFSAVEHLVVNRPPEAVYSAVRNLDLLTIQSRTADMAMWVRGLPERLRRRVPPRRPTRLTFDDLVASGDWVLLGEQPGREVIFGAAGRFWTPIVRWEQVEPEQFVQYGKPGRGKIVSSLSVRPYGRNSSLVTYDIRTVLNDPITHRIFKLYWLVVKPFVRALMRATVRAVAKQGA